MTQTLTTTEPFIWHGREGDIPVTMMRTRHLFYTLRMVWHNLGGEPVSEIKRYTFDPDIYTPAYLKLAIKALYAELCTRNDIQHSHRLQLMMIKLAARKATTNLLGAS